MFIELSPIDKEMEELLSKMCGRKLPAAKTYFITLRDDRVVPFFNTLFGIEDLTKKCECKQENISYYYDNNFNHFIKKIE